jgi:FkbM family methyltransferase
MPTHYRALQFGWKHRLVAVVSQRVNFTYTIRHGLASGMRRRGGLGFVPWGPAETAETRFLRALNLGGKVVYDIGAFEGLLTMFFSRRARFVIAWEPNPESRRRLLTNLRLNRLSNVLVRDVGLADAPGEATLVYDPLMPGAASGAGAVASQIRDSAPSLAEVGMRLSILDEEVRTQALPLPDFLKIDVKGWSFRSSWARRRRSVRTGRRSTSSCTEPSRKTSVATHARWCPCSGAGATATPFTSKPAKRSRPTRPICPAISSHGGEPWRQSGFGRTYFRTS